MPMRRNLLNVSAALGLLAALAVPSGCARGPYGRMSTTLQRPPVHTLWGGARVGFGMPFAVDLSSAEDNFLDLDVNGSPHPLYAVSLMYRGNRIDAGARLDGFSGGTFEGLSRARRFGGRTRVLATVRWRVIDADWGGLFLSPAIGWAAYSHDDDLLDLAETAAGVPPGAVRSGTDRFTGGFAFKIGVGVMVYATRWVIVFAEVATAGGETSITVAGGNEVDFAEGRLHVSMGVELRVF